MTVSVPSLSSKVDPEVRRMFAALVDQFNKVLDGRTPVAVAESIGGSTTTEELLTTIPKAVVNLTATSGFNSIVLQWTPGQDQSVLVGYDIYRATVDDIGQAVLIGNTSVTMYVDVPSESSTAVEYYYWVQAISAAGDPGPFNAAAGTSARTSTDPTYVMEVLRREVTDHLVASEPLTEQYIQAGRFAIINPETTPKVITSLTRTGTTATATCEGHGFTTGTTQIIAAAKQPEYNGAKLITVTDADHFTYPVLATAATPATVDPDFTTIIVSGSAAKIPFIVSGGVVYISAAMIEAATITNAMIANATIENAKIVDLAASKIKTGTLAANQSIIVAVSGTTEENDYAELTEGDLRFFYYFAGEHHLYKSVKRATNQGYISGAGNLVSVAEDGDNVHLPGYWRTQPRVMLSPHSLQTYSQADETQDQRIELQVLDLKETTSGSGVYEFTVSAKLLLDANATVISSSLGTSYSANWENVSNTVLATGTQRTGINNAETATISGTLQAGASYGGTLNARLKVQYSLNSGTWTDAGTLDVPQNNYPNGSSHAINFSFNLTLSGSGTNTYQFRIYAVWWNSEYSGAGTTLSITATEYISDATVPAYGTVTWQAVEGD